MNSRLRRKCRAARSAEPTMARYLFLYFDLLKGGQVTLRERVAALVKWKTGKKPSKLELNRHMVRYRADAKAGGITPSKLVALVESVRDEDAETKPVRRTTKKKSRKT